MKNTSCAQCRSCTVVAVAWTGVRPLGDLEPKTRSHEYCIMERSTYYIFHGWILIVEAGDIQIKEQCDFWYCISCRVYFELGLLKTLSLLRRITSEITSKHMCCLCALSGIVTVSDEISDTAMWSCCCVVTMLRGWGTVEQINQQEENPTVGHILHCTYMDAWCVCRARVAMCNDRRLHYQDGFVIFLSNYVLKELSDNQVVSCVIQIMIGSKQESHLR